MINYPSIINILKSDKYVDKSNCFENFFGYRYHTLANCRATGSSLFLKTFACFLDDAIDTRDIFCHLKIGKSEEFGRHINSYRVLWLDFSDFNANTYECAIEYVKRMMSDVYKSYYKDFEITGGSFNGYKSFEHALDIIEGKASDDVLRYSLRNLLLKLRGYEGHNNERKLAVLIDNIILLESVASENGYSDRMNEFLMSFLVEDVYKYCDIFLQIGDGLEERDSWFYTKRYLAYRMFSVSSVDVRQRFCDLVVAKENQSRFDEIPISEDKYDWNVCVASGRQIIKQAKLDEERRRLEHICREKERYNENLLPDIPLFSSNMGLRKKCLDKSSSKYAELNAHIREIYSNFSPKYYSDDIYKSFQKLDRDKHIINNPKDLESIIENLSKQYSKWDTSVDSSWGDWVQTMFTFKDSKCDGSPARPENLKVYACLKNADIQGVFIDSLKYLMQHAETPFAAKIAIFSRSDQMCYWISQNDFKYLEDFYRPYSKEMVKALPFVAYKGMLGISRDFPGVDCSHNSVQAHIISDYLKNIKTIEDVDLEDMYNSYIAKWNGDIYGDDFGGFKYNSTLSFIVIMDSLDVILNDKGITNESFLMSGDSRMWHILADSRCWADVNEMYSQMKTVSQQR